MMYKNFALAALILAGTGAFADGHASGDAAAGEKLFNRCKACHSVVSTDGEVIQKGGAVGPNLYGVYNRTAGTEDEFGTKFRDSIREAGEKGLVWNEADFVAYVADPKKFLVNFLDNGKAKSGMSFKLKRKQMPKLSGHIWFPLDRRKLQIKHLFAFTVLLLFDVSIVAADNGTAFTIQSVTAPVGAQAREPSLSTLPDGRIVMSWTERDNSVRMALFDGAGWSEARTIHQSAALFVNWADFPSVVALSDGTLAAHWLESNGPGSYQYGVKIAFSSDEGRSWTAPLIPHDDGSQREHGFVSLVPDATGGLTAIWLDGRAYDSAAEGDRFENAMQVRSRQIDPDGTMGPESLLDARACTCCQTSAVRIGTGDIIAVYRDRTAEEIRDISVVRLSDQGWSDPATVHDDGWEIAGCPVNGPAVDALGLDVSTVWFTGANNEAKVRIAFSGDGGAHFDDPLQLDLGAPGGRVDVVQMSDGTALALWMEYARNGEAIVLCRVSRDTGCTSPQALHINRGRESVGFPRLTRWAGGVYVAWTGSTDGADGNTTVRIVKVMVAPPTPTAEN